MALIKLDNIRKVYGHGDSQTIALDGVSLEIKKGEFVSIVGPSGSGKSTLMHIIGLLDEPSEGTYELDGKNVERLSETARAHARLKKIGFVFQMFNLLGRSTALENILIPLVYANKPKKSREKHALKLLEQVGLQNRADHQPSELSGGQIQRVAIARALANDPVLILADEPTGNLDSKSGEQVLDLLVDLNKKGTTIVLVTHDQNIASRAKRTISVFDGKIVETGSTEKSTKAPATKKKARKKTTKRRSKKG